jgi:multiple sugar transport system substrate-binding protein
MGAQHHSRLPLTRRAVLTLAGSAALAVACRTRRREDGAAPPAGSGEAPRELQPATITYSFWGDQADLENHTAMATAVMERYPAIKVETMHIPQDYPTKLLAMYAGGAPPDTSLIDMMEVQAYIRRGQLLDLNRFVQRDRAQFKPDDFDAKSLEHLRDAKGGLFGFPRQQSVNCIFYNENLFHEAGLKSPYDQYTADAWTWDAYVDAARALTRRDAGGAMTQLGTAWGLERCFIWSAGGKEFDDNRAPKQCLYDSPEAIDALQFMADLRYRHKVAESPSDRLQGAQGDTFAAGKVAMMMRWTSSLNAVKAITSFTWNVVPYPKRRTYATDSAGLHGLCAAREGQHHEAAWRLIGFIAGPEGQLLLAKTGAYTPARRSLVQEAFKLMEMPQAPLFYEYQKHGQVRLVSVGQMEINRLLREELAALWNGQEGAAPAAKRAAQRVNEYLATNPQ